MMYASYFLYFLHGEATYDVLLQCSHIGIAKGLGKIYVVQWLSLRSRKVVNCASCNFKRK